MKLGKRIISFLLAFSAVITLEGNNCVTAEETAVEKLSQNTLYSDGFETSVSSTTSIVTGRAMPAGWKYEDLRKPANPAISYGIATEEKASGNASIGVEAVGWNSAGLLSPKIPINNDVPAFDIFVKSKTSPDYLNNRTKYIVRFYKDDTLLVSKEGFLNTSATDWTENKIRVDLNLYPITKRFDSVQIKLHTAFSGKAGAKGEGMVYFDDFKVDAVYDGNPVQLDIRTKDELSWYNPGDVVTYKPQMELPEEVYEVKVILRNSYGDTVYESVIAADEFERNGWSYTPHKTGHYTVAFIGDTPYGEMTFASVYTRLQKQFIIPERSFVVANEAKPVEERNDMLFASHYEGTSSQLDDPEVMREAVYRMHDVIGFRGMRFHSFPWETETHKPHEPTNPAKGFYNWTDTDVMFELASKYGFKTMVTVLFTPKWASKRAQGEGTITVKHNTSNIPDWAVAPPTRTEYYTEYLRELAKRYGEQIDYWEIWNEMNPGSRYFEYGDVHDYVKLIKGAYETVKEEQPDDEVIMGGILCKTPLYYEELLDAGLYDYTDALVSHGKKDSVAAYREKEQERGLEPKPWYNTEAHYIITNTYSTEPFYTERQQALDLMKWYFWDIKEGAELIALFQVTTNFDMECIEHAKSRGTRALSYGMFRRYPFAEPRLMAMVLNTFFNLMGKDFSYTSEYYFEDSGVKAVRFLNDGEPLVATWVENKDSEFDDKFRACMTEKTRVIDWDGNEISPDDTLRNGTVYFVTGMDAAALDGLSPAASTVLTDGRTMREQVSTEVGYANKTQLFDEVTFVEADEINWIETDWQWVNKSGNRREGFDARFAVSLNEKGMYLMVEADDDVQNFNNDIPSALYETDSVQIAVDVSGEGYSDMRTEIDVALTNNGPVLYKRAAANVNGAVPFGWTTVGQTLSSTYANITSTDNKILYKIFIPASEMFPFEFDENNKEWRMSLVVNDNDGKERRGLLRWSNGIDGGKDVGKYGKIILP